MKETDKKVINKCNENHKKTQELNSLRNTGTKNSLHSNFALRSEDSDVEEHRTHPRLKVTEPKAETGAFIIAAHDQSLSRITRQTIKMVQTQYVDAYDEFISVWLTSLDPE